MPTPPAFTFISERLEELNADNLSYSLERQSGSSMLLFSGFTNNGITCIFGPDGGNWQAGEVLRLHVVDAANVLRPFDQSLILEESGISAGPASDELQTELPMVTSDESWTIALTSHEESGGLTTGRIHLICTEDELPEVSSLSGSFRFTPADAGHRQFFSNLTLDGPLTITGSGANFQLEFSGLFVPGMVQVVLSQAAGELLRANVDLDFSLPRALIDTSAIEGMNYDTQQRSLDRETVECSVSFAPLQPVSTEFLRPVLTPAPSVTTTDSELTFSGSIIHATVPTGTWQSDTEFGAGLQLAFESALQFDWTNGQSVLFPVTAVAEMEDSISVSMPRRPVVLDAEGFILTIIPRGADTDQFDWTRVKLSSDNMLLNNNIDSFAVSMENVDFVGQPAVNLIFKRGRGLGQEAFDALAGQLEDSGEIAITLYWDEIRYSYQGMVSMVR